MARKQSPEAWALSVLLVYGGVSVLACLMAILWGAC